jgi:hypothetical protein
MVDDRPVRLMPVRSHPVMGVETVLPVAVGVAMPSDLGLGVQYQSHRFDRTPGVKQRRPVCAKSSTRIAAISDTRSPA